MQTVNVRKGFNDNLKNAMYYILKGIEILEIEK